MYPVTVPCRNIVESMERSDWAKEHGIEIDARTWEVINQRQHLTYNFKKEADATMFALRWACE